jgi:hypothetical protein
MLFRQNHNTSRLLTLFALWFHCRDYHIWKCRLVCCISEYRPRHLQCRRPSGWAWAWGEDWLAPREPQLKWGRPLRPPGSW